MSRKIIPFRQDDYLAAQRKVSAILREGAPAKTAEQTMTDQALCQFRPITDATEEIYDESGFPVGRAGKRI